MNSNYYPDRDQYHYFPKRSHNITIAINSKNGLAAPNIKNVQNLSIIEIDEEIK